MRAIKRMTLILFAAVLASFALAGSAFAANASDIKLDSPIRAVTLSATATRSDFQVMFDNATQADHLVNISIDTSQLPEADKWDVGLWDRFFSYKISQLIVGPPPDPTNVNAPAQPSYTLRMSFTSDNRPDPGDYPVTLTVTDASDPSIVYGTATYTVTVPPAAVDTGTVTAQVDYPNLQGPNTSTFSFEVDVKNGMATDHSFALAATVLDANQQPTTGWDVTFSPAFGASKTIQSVAVSSKLDQRVDVNVKPPSGAAAGDYYIPFTATSEDGTLVAKATLRARIVGQGTLAATTPTGNLSMNATAGKETTNTFRLQNNGTADLNNVVLSSQAPQDWVVKFQGLTANTVASLPANNYIDVQFTVQPPKDAVPGDYQVTLKGQGLGTSDSAVLRVTVTQSTIWGWLGIVLVILVIGSLVGLFWRLGRR